MPLVDLDDELSIVDETEEEDEGILDTDGLQSDVSAMEMSATEDMSAMSGGQSRSADEREQQWIIDSILNHQDDDESIDNTGVVYASSETDDDSLYIMDPDNMVGKTEGGKNGTPKTKNIKKAAPSPDDDDYHNYMDVSNIVDNFGEDVESEKKWKKKVLGKNKKAQDKKKSQEQPVKEKSKRTFGRNSSSNSDKSQEEKTSTKKAFGRNSSNNSDKSQEEKASTKKAFGRRNTPPSKSNEAPKDTWKNPFRGSSNKKKSQEQSPRQQHPDGLEPYEANLAPLGGFDDVDADVKVNTEENKKEGWMPKIGFLAKNAPQEQAPPKQEAELGSDYAANVNPLGAVTQDVQANNVAVEESPVQASETPKKKEENDKSKAPHSSWGSRMTSLIGSVTEPKQEAAGAVVAGTSDAADKAEEPKDSLKEEKNNAVDAGVTDTVALADDIASFATSLTASETKVEEKDTVALADDIASFATSLTASEPKVEENVVTDDIVSFATSLTKTEGIDEEKGISAEEAGVSGEGKNDDNVEETEGEFVGADQEAMIDEVANTLIIASVEDGDQTAIPEGTDDTTEKKKTWKTKVKSVRKQGSSKLSSIRKSSKISKKSFTQDKINAMEAVDDTSADSLGHSIESTDVTKGVSEVSSTRKKRIVAAILGLLFTIVIIAVTVSAVKKGSPPETTPTPTPDGLLEQVEYIYKLLLPISGQNLTVEDEEAPLVKAFVWTVEDSVIRGNDTDEVIIERYVSAVVYFALGGEDWTNQHNFLSHDDLCTWNTADTSGIICNDNEVFQLWLPENNLSGEIPREIRHLKTLRSIHLSGNGITGEVPDAIGQLDWLEELDLSANAMSGPLPDSLFSPNQLRDIMLNENDFYGSINPSLGDSPVLERFSAFDNSFTGRLPDSVGESTVLKVLDLTENTLTGTIPEFAESSSMMHLYLGMNDLEGSIPESLAAAPLLESLHIPDNLLNGILPDFAQSGSIRDLEIMKNGIQGSLGGILGKLPTTIERLVLSNNNIGGSIPTRIGAFKKLFDLRLGDNNIAGTIPETIGQLTELSDALFLTQNGLIGPIPTTIGNLKKLRSLRLRLNYLTGAIPSEIGGLTLLTDLMLDGNELQGDIPEEIADLPELDKFLLSENRGITGGVEPFCARPEELTRFGVNTCGDTDGLDCPCCNICCKSDPSYGCLQI